MCPRRHCASMYRFFHYFIQNHKFTTFFPSPLFTDRYAYTWLSNRKRRRRRRWRHVGRTTIWRWPVWERPPCWRSLSPPIGRCCTQSTRVAAAAWCATRTGARTAARSGRTPTTDSAGRTRSTVRPARRRGAWWWPPDSCRSAAVPVRPASTGPVASASWPILGTGRTSRPKCVCATATIATPPPPPLYRRRRWSRPSPWSSRPRDRNTGSFIGSRRFPEYGHYRYSVGYDMVPTHLPRGISGYAHSEYMYTLSVFFLSIHV